MQVRSFPLILLASLVAALLALSLAAAPRAEAYVFFGQTGWITRTDDDGSNVRSLVGGFPDATSGIDAAGGQVWWAVPGAGRLWTAGADGSGGGYLQVGGSPIDVAIGAEHVFWSDWTNSIGRVRRDGSDITTGFISAPGISQLAVDGDYLYWTSSSGNRIGRARVDGSDVQPNFITGLSAPLGIAVDDTSIYWVNGGSDSIGRARRDGSGVTQRFISDAGPAGMGIAVDATHLYWVTQANNNIVRARRDGSDVELDFYENGNALYGVAADGLPVTPTISTAPSPASALAGSGRLGLSFTISGGIDPDGVLVVAAYGPDDPTCAGDPASVRIGNIGGNGTYEIDGFVPEAAGVYRWTVEYEGDSRNRAVAQSCGDGVDAEALLNEWPLSLSVPDADGVVGEPLAATVAFGVESGELTVRLHGPDEATCALPPVAERTITLDAAADGSYAVAPFTPTAPGAYRWTASYAGDAVNAPAAVDCAGAAVVQVGEAPAPEPPVDPPLPPVDPPLPPVDPPAPPPVVAPVVVPPPAPGRPAAPAPPARPVPALSGMTLASRCVRPASTTDRPASAPSRSGGARVAAALPVTVGLRLRMAGDGPVEVTVERALGTRGLARCPAANPDARFDGILRTVVDDRTVRTAAAAGASTRAGRASASATTGARAVTLRLRLQPALYRVTVRVRRADGGRSAPRSRWLRVLAPRG